MTSASSRAHAMAAAGGRQPRPLLLALLLTLPLISAPRVQAQETMGAIVRAFCLSAFANEMSHAGKTAPEGMANFACGCVADRLRDGSSLEAARQDCRALTARRYPI